MTRIRRDKDWSTATTLDELRGLFRKKPESTDFSLLLGSSDVKDVPIKRSLDSPEASPSPEKMKKTTSGPDDDEPSTSFAAFKCKIKEEPPDVPEGSSRGQKRDKHDGSPDGIADVRSARKRLKVERGIKKETEDPSLAIVKKKRKKKTDDEKEEEKESDLVARKTKKQEDHNVNQLAGGVAESFSAETTVFDSDAENDVSNNYIVIARVDLFRDDAPGVPSTARFFSGYRRRRPEGRSGESRARLRRQRQQGRAEVAQNVSFSFFFPVVILRDDNSRSAVLELRTQIALSSALAVLSASTFYKSSMILRRSRDNFVNFYRPRSLFLSIAISPSLFLSLSILRSIFVVPEQHSPAKCA